MVDPTAPRILISRLSALGDCIHALPMLSALREKFPDAFVSWVVESGTAPLLAGHPYIDKLVVVKRGWTKNPWAIWNLRCELVALKFDVALDPQSLTKSSLAAWLSGAPRRIGFSGAYGREFSTWLNNEYVEARQLHMVDRGLELLRPLGIEVSEPHFYLPEDAVAGAKVDDFLAAEHVHGPFAVLNPGAGWKSKVWPAAHYGQVAQLLWRERGLQSVVVWAGDQELAWAREIVATSNGHAVLAPATSLLELSAVMRRTQIFVGSDTGPLHLAAALGTRCVGLYGPTRAEECGPHGRQHVSVQVYYHGGTCRERRNAENDAMVAITPGMAFHACEQALDGVGRGGTVRAA